MRVILASSSPYRQALLRQIRLPFMAVKPEVDEAAFPRANLSPNEIAQSLAALKGEDVVCRFQADLIIASDQVAHFDDEILNKPGTIAKAENQLSKLSGQTHALSTALWMRHPTLGVYSHLDETKIKLRTLTSDEIRAYVKTDNPLDCAGAYKIESAGISLIEEIKSADQTAIVGLPLIALCHARRQWRLPAPFLWPKGELE